MKCQRGDWFSHVFLDVFIFCRFANPAERERDSLIGNDKVFAMHLQSFTNSPKKKKGTLYAHSASLSVCLGNVLYFRFNVTPRAFVFVSKDRNGERQCGMVAAAGAGDGTGKVGHFKRTKFSASNRRFAN